MAPKAKGKGNARAAPKRTRLAQWQRANERQKLRRKALEELNAMTV